MRAVLWKGVGQIAVEEVPDPQLREPTDAIVRLTASAICGTDLHLIRGTLPGMKPGRILGHEGIGIVEQVGDGVRNFSPGDRVVIPSTIACGHWTSSPRAGWQPRTPRSSPVTRWRCSAVAPSDSSPSPAPA